MAEGHKITITPSDAHVEVKIGATTVASSARRVIVSETGLPDRYYLPREDVHTELLSPTDTKTRCPYKGQASYWSVRIGEVVHDDIVWSYETPIPEAEGITGLFCFYNERVDLSVDGQRTFAKRP